MYRPPPIPTRTDTPFPYTTPCRSEPAARAERDHLQPRRSSAAARTSRTMNAGAPPIPTIDDVRAAADRLRGRAIRTPLLESALLNEELGCRLLLKAECLDRKSTRLNSSQ